MKTPAKQVIEKKTSTYSELVCKTRTYTLPPGVCEFFVEVEAAYAERTERDEIPELRETG